MSLRYRDSSGNETIVSGLTPGGDIEAGAVDTRSGVFSFSVASGSHEKFTVTFDTPMIDNDYIVDIWSDIHNMEYLTFNIEGKKANGFDVNVNNAYGATINRSGIKYKAYKVYTVQHAAQNAEDIANIKAVIPLAASSTNQLTPKKYVDDADTALDGRVSNLEDLIPTGASVDNQLATKSDVDDAETEAQSRLKVVSTMPATPAEGTVVLYIGSDPGLTPGGIYQYQSGSWVLISAADIDIDSSIDSTSENPVQNKVIAEALDDKQNIEFIGTTAEWNALSTAQKNKYTLVNLTDDKEALGVEAVDSLINGDMRPVTSNAVYDSTNDIINRFASLGCVDVTATLTSKNCNDIPQACYILGPYATFSTGWSNLPFPDTSGFAGVIYCFRGYYQYSWQIAVKYSGQWVALRTQNTNGTWNSWKQIYTYN